MVGALGALLEVVGGGPAAPEDTFLGVFVEALAVELGAEIAAVDVAFAAALFGDRGHAGVTLEVGGVLEALALGAQAAQEPRSQHRAGAGEAGKDRDGRDAERRSERFVSHTGRRVCWTSWSWRQMSWTRSTKLSIRAVSSVTGTALATKARRCSRSLVLREPLR